MVAGAKEVEQRAAAYFANIESLRLLAKEVGLSADGRVTRTALSAAIGRLRGGVDPAVIASALDALPWGTAQPERAEDVADWADVEVWWSSWASKLCVAETPCRKIRIKSRFKGEGSTGHVCYTIDVVDPEVATGRMVRVCGAEHRFSEFDALRQAMLADAVTEPFVTAAEFPPKTWLGADLTPAELVERSARLSQSRSCLQGAEIALCLVCRRTMLGAWLTELLTGPLSKLKEPCDGVAKLHAFVGKTNRASAAQHFGRLMLVFGRAGMDDGELAKTLALTVSGRRVRRVKRMQTYQLTDV